MQRSKWLRHGAAVALVALAATACGGGETTTDPSDDPSASESTTDEPSEDMTDEPVEVTGRGDGTFTIGRVLPESGFLDYLGGPMIGGVQLALADINAAGGVLGADAQLLEFDSGTSGDITATNVNNAIAQGADVIVGAASSGATLGVLSTLNSNGIPNCSPSATSGDFDTTASASLFFRTVPPDQFVAPIIANEIISDGNAANIVIVQLQDAYGDFIAGAVTDALSAQGVEVAQTIAYPPDETLFESQANEVVAANPSAVLVVGFREASGLLKAMVEKGLDASTFYGADGVFSSQLPGLAGVSIDGMKVIGASGSNEFNARLADFGVSDFLYGGQAYDCTILMALWAVAEGTDDASTWSTETLLGLTDGGEKCTTYADCVALLEAGTTDIDYDGASGELALAGVDGGTAGNPTKATYAVAQYQDGELVPVSSTPVDLS